MSTGSGFACRVLSLTSANRATIRPFDKLADVDAFYKGHLQIELGELGLAIGAQIFIAEAAGDLVVALQPGHHQQLLHLLRRLGKGVEFAGMHTAGDDEVAGAFGRALEQNWRLHVKETCPVQVIADEGDNAVAKDEVALHALPAQVQIAVFEPHRVGDLAILVDREGRGASGVEHLQRLGADLDLARVQIGVDQPFGPGSDHAFDLHHVFAAHFGRVLVGGGRHVGVEYDLNQAGEVAQVEEDEAAMVAAAMHPPRQRHPLPHVCFAKFATINRLQHAFWTPRTGDTDYQI